MMIMISPWLYSVILNRNEEMIVEYSRIVRYEWKWMLSEMNVVALWWNCMSKTELIVFDCDIGFDERIMDNMSEWLKECDNWYVCCSYNCLKVMCLIWVSMCWLVIDMIWE